MPKVAILHPGIYGNPKNDALTSSFLADVTVVRYTAGMTKEELLAAIPAGLTHVSFVYHYPGYSSLPFFPDIPIESENDVSEVIPSQSKYRYFSDAVIDILQTLRSVSSVDGLTVDILACDLRGTAYAEEVKKIETDLSINIRFSVDKTGNPSSGANWTLESEEPAVNVRDIYFTDGVLAWNSVLAGDISQAIKDGSGNCATYISWNGTNTFTVLNDFAWTDISFNGSSVTNTEFISLGPGEKFDGSNYAIDISNQTAWLGLLASSVTISTQIAPQIKNLGVTGGVITTNGGAIIRISQQYFKIESCYSTGSIGQAAGGIAGFQAGANGTCDISGCHSTGNINVSLAGGIVGQRAGEGAGSTCIITNCWSTGVINGSSAGGIAGQRAALSNGTCIITNCSSEGVISGSTAGGIVGANAGSNTGSKCTITNCYSTGFINGASAGGIAGGSAGGFGGKCTITNCYSTGDITNTGGGGITGNTAAFNTGTCDISGCYSTGHIIGSDAGGITGTFLPGIINGKCTITNCYSTGDISGNNAGGISGSFSGAGSGTTCKITNCYSTGVINGGGAGGITSINTALTCIITCCVCNGTPIVGGGTATITGSSTNLSLINGTIYPCWNVPSPSSVWMPGGPVSVTINGLLAIYNLPILIPFRNSPWNSDLYNAADDLAGFGTPTTNSFALRVNPFVALSLVLVYTQEAMDALVAGLPLPLNPRVSWAEFGMPAGSLLRDLGRSVVVQVSPTNPLHAYRFQKIQLIRGPTTEGVGGSPTDIDAWLTGYICVWAAGGVAPVFP